MDFMSVIPPVLALVIVFVTRSVYAALGGALLFSETILKSYNPLEGFFASIDRMVAVFESGGNARILIFCLIIGILITYMRDSGGVHAFARSLINSRFANSKSRAETAVAATGTLVFVETNVSLLSSGVLGRALYDAHGLSRQRLAYIIDSTSAPISVLFLMFNAWGAYALGLIEPYGLENPVGVVFGTIGWNFYAIIAVVLVYATAISGKVFGPLATGQDSKTDVENVEEPKQGKAIFMWLPLLVMVVGSLGFMYWSGDGNISRGNGSQSILLAIILAILVAAGLIYFTKALSGEVLKQKAISGVAEMIPLVLVLWMAIALGSSLRELGTGTYIAEIASGSFPAVLLPALLFCVAGAMSFMTGTSWGTYGILVPIAMPLADALGVPPSLALATVLSGGVWGDHCSPISDTTLIASVAAGTDHLEHVRTQLPYAIFGGVIAIIGYLVAGFVLF